MSGGNARELLEKLVDLAGGSVGGGYVLALDGEGLEQVPEALLVRGVEYEVHRPRSELGLRRLLWKLGSKPFIGLMQRDLAERLPPDLLRRSAGARVHALEPADVLASALGTSVLALDHDDTRQLALEHVEALRERLMQRTLPTLIDNQLLEELIIELLLGDRVRQWSPAQVLATCWQRASGWDERIRQLMRRQLPQLHNAHGRLICWALEVPGRERLDELLLRGVLLAQDAPAGEAAQLPKVVWGQVWEAEGAVGLTRPTVRLLLCRLVDEVLRGALIGELESQALIRRADEAALALLTPEQIQLNPILPSGFERGAMLLAARLASGDVEAAHGLARLRAHRAARLHPRVLPVLEQLARLARFVAANPGPDVSSVDRWLRWYQEHGAFVDWTIMQLQRTQAAEPRFRAHSDALVKQARAVRQRANERFAELLAPDWERALHTPEVTPLYKVWERQVVPKLAAGERVFVVVLDGCSYAVFLDLMQRMAGSELDAIGLCAAQAGAERVLGERGLALLPSVTSHSRGALFLGRIPSDPLEAEQEWRKREAKTDKPRLSQNPELKPYKSKLFLKGDLADGGQALLGALIDPELVMVAAVFNAVDDQIGSSNTGVPLQIDPDQITGLLPALRRALGEGGRRVLLTADHGHTLYIDKSYYRGSATQGARYKILEGDEEPPTGFIEVELRGLGGIAPPARAAFAWQSGAYLGSPAVGYHGGCALEELVVPMAWLERSGVEPDAPAWWYDVVRVVAPDEVEQVDEVEILPPDATPAKQANLF